jgi:hypothetical protein
MEQVFSLALVGFTSVGAYLLGTRVVGLSARDIRKAVGKMFECFGVSLVFFVVNLGAGMIGILATRVITRGFVSLYMAADVTVLVLSVLQGVTFVWWRDLSTS